jgi:hypothetical protein
MCVSNPLPRSATDPSARPATSQGTPATRPAAPPSLALQVGPRAGSVAVDSPPATPHVDSLSVARPAAESPQTGSVADLYDADPVALTAGTLVTNVTLNRLETAAAMFAVDLDRVALREFNARPEELTEAAATWLHEHFGEVLDRHAAKVAADVDALSRRIKALEEAVKTLHARGLIWRTHEDSPAHRIIGESIVRVTSEALGVEVSNAR